MAELLMKLDLVMMTYVLPKLPMLSTLRAPPAIALHLGRHLCEIAVTMRVRPNEQAP